MGAHNCHNLTNNNNTDKGLAKAWYFQVCRLWVESVYNLSSVILNISLEIMTTSIPVCTFYKICWVIMCGEIYLHLGTSNL